jgi:erythromycin esterase-like protein
MNDLSREIRAAAVRITDDRSEELREWVGDASIVLLGEATHGTHEFYAMRAELTRWLIEERGFGAVVAEADWPDAFRVARFARGHGEDATAEEALGDFERFPQWMWRNAVMRDFARWLREHNRSRDDGRVGFYGMDLYSLYRSIAKVVGFLDEVDPEAASRARERYACFGRADGRAEVYGQMSHFGITEDCERQAVEQLLEMREELARNLSGDSVDPEERFFAAQNAAVVKNAERYYRGMFDPSVNTWNVRDRHMFDICQALREHLAKEGSSDKIVVWAHNSHLGDARATQFAKQGQLNVGQLLREEHGDDCLLVGFSTHTGSVTAAQDWDGPALNRRVRPSLTGSWEQALHQIGWERFAFRTDDAPSTREQTRLGRAIGVVYRPETERWSHYFDAVLGRQYDVVIHLDETHALEPLERWAHVEEDQTFDAPETYPSGL